MANVTVTIRTVDDQVSPVPIDGVLVSIYDSTGESFITSGTTSVVDGEVQFSLPGDLAGVSYVATLFKAGVSFQPTAAKLFDAKDPPSDPDFNAFQYIGHIGMIGAVVTLAVRDTATPTPNPVEGVYARLFSSPEDSYITTLVTASTGEAEIVLAGDVGPDGKEYIIRLNPPSGYYGVPTRTISVIDPLGELETNVFDFIVYPPSDIPVSTDPDMCCVSGCFTDPALRPLKNLTLIFHPREGYPLKVIAGMPFSAEPTVVRSNIIASELYVVTDKNGCIEIDLPRESVYDVFVQGLGAGDHTLQASVYIPDLAGIDVKEVLFPYLTALAYLTSSLSLAIGESAEIEVEILASNAQPIAGTEALNTLLTFTSSDPEKVAVAVTSAGKLLVSALAVGSVTIDAERVTGSFAPRRPAVPDLVVLPSIPIITVT